MYDYKIDPEYAEQKLIDLEDRSRRNNLRVDGILETPGETWEDCEEKLQQVFQEKLGLECPIEIKREHRTSSRQNNTMVTTHEGKNVTESKQAKRNKHL